MSDDIIVPLRIESAGELAALHQLSMPVGDGWNEPSLARLMQADAAVGMQTHTNDGTITGFVLAFAAADEAEVLAICVAPEHRRSGLGRKLLRRLERDLANRAITRLFLEARVSNFGARRLYEQAGFLETGRRRTYYEASAGSPAEDAVTMAKDLVRPSVSDPESG
jgi:[ribosomal protein S18]-alanine N-acetyltransferase